MTPKFFKNPERLSQTIEGIRIRHYVISSGLSKMAGAAEAKNPGVIYEPLVTDNQTRNNVNVIETTETPDTRLKVGVGNVTNAMLAAAKDAEVKDQERADQARQDIDSIFYDGPNNMTGMNYGA